MLRVCLAIASAVSVLWSFDGLATEASLQESIESILVEEGLTGIAWTVIDEEVNIGSAGLQDNRSRSAFGPGTRFHIGSLTKTVLATGVLRLATEGRIDIDAPILNYLPGLHLTNPWEGSSDVTVRHLLDHTSGMNDAQLWHIFSERADPDASLIAAFPDPELQLRVRSQPGSRFSYSNTGYTLLGMIIEAVVGDRYETYLDEYVLAPLAMHDSTFAFTTQEGDNTAPTLAWGHVDDGSRYAATPTFLRPAGQFTTTTSDLGRFAEFLMGDGVVDGSTFVDKIWIKSRGKPFATEAANEGLAAGYALGLGRRDRHGVVGYCHGGNVIGFVAMLCVFPDERKAFAYSVNTDSETAEYGRLESLFIEALEIAEPPLPPTGVAAVDTSEWHGRYILRPNRFQMFEYLDTVFGAIEVGANKDGLTLKSVQRDTRRLRPVGGHLYSANDRSTTSHVLYRGHDGKYLVSDGFQTFEKVPAAYLFAHWISVFLGLAGLTWVLISGAISLVRHRSGMLRRPEGPAFIASVLLLVPIPFFVAQSFMSLGDFTPASVLLAVVTLLLPIGMLLSILLARKNWRASLISRLQVMAAVFVLQWCVVLATSGMLPLMLWS